MSIFPTLAMIERSKAKIKTVPTWNAKYLKAVEQSVCPVEQHTEIAWVPRPAMFWKEQMPRCQDYQLNNKKIWWRSRKVRRWHPVCLRLQWVINAVVIIISKCTRTALHWLDHWNTTKMAIHNPTKHSATKEKTWPQRWTMSERNLHKKKTLLQTQDQWPISVSCSSSVSTSSWKSCASSCWQ